MLIYLVDEQAQFGCLLASDGVVSAPLQALRLQRIVERLSPGQLSRCTCGRTAPACCRRPPR
ncbi:hypothetical protein OV079_52805 [Nannocystis pusilla]|uniref:Uncharacterized protein n=1 Tax=Nannocystis pusilla TaxID=889268 RepID=A0A9X3F105_9BACT|nr:hypothetical protein [Nannocystis pusilla]MCY1014062.1 hypothetical protein [Nannocystis pusilla]